MDNGLKSITVRSFIDRFLFVRFSHLYPEIWRSIEQTPSIHMFFTSFTLNGRLCVCVYPNLFHTLFYSIASQKLTQIWNTPTDDRIQRKSSRIYWIMSVVYAIHTQRHPESISLFIFTFVYEELICIIRWAVHVSSMCSWMGVCVCIRFVCTLHAVRFDSPCSHWIYAHRIFYILLYIQWILI